MRQLIKIIKFSITFSYVLSIFFNVSWTHRLLYNAIGKICFDSLSFCIKASHRLSSVLQEPPLNGYVFIRLCALYSRSAKSVVPLPLITLYEKTVGEELQLTPAAQAVSG